MKKLLIVMLIGISGSLQAQEINAFDESGNRHGTWSKNFEGSDQLRYEGQFDHGKEVGEFKYYQLIGKKSKLAATKQFNSNDNSAIVKFLSLNGNTISEGTMNGKNYIGEWRYYHKNSDLLMTLEHYNEKGNLDGKRSVYYDTGQIAEELNYHDGKLEGESKYYSLEGVVVKTYEYKNDQLHGMSKHYDGNGVIMIEGPYKLGKKSGIWTYYKNGEFLEEKDFTYRPKFKKKQ